MKEMEEVMPPLARCHVVRTSVLLGSERVTHALKIILTSSALEETTQASRTLCPGLDESTREEGYHRKPTGNPTGVRGLAGVYVVAGTPLSG